MIGKTVSHYKIISKLGEGGMGVVYKAEDTRLGRLVALKFLPASLGTEDAAKKRFILEAKAASSLEHPNICAVHDIGETDDGRMFIAMPHYNGDTLQERIARGPLQIDETIDIVTQLTSGLAKAHEQGIVHRDIKPGNIFITRDGHVKVLDFGLAKLTAEHPHAIAESDPTVVGGDHTASGVMMGTAAYMSPEQALGKKVDTRTDVFALGVVLYEMITGQRAFSGDTPAAVFDAILNRTPTAPVELNRDVPTGLQDVIDKALEKDPDLRYQSASDMAADLKRLRRDESTGGGPATQARSAGDGRRRKVTVIGTIALVIAVTVVATVVLRNSGEDSGAPFAVEPSESGPSIAVLPFVNASNDASQEYFSDGLTEDIITELSSYHELSVIALNSTRRYRDSDLGVRKIGEELGVRYILQGSVRRSGQRIKVSIQLSNAEDGRSVWGTSYERDLTARDLFELQEELTLQVVAAIAGPTGAMTRAELPDSRHKLPASMDSYDCVLRAYEYIQLHTAQNHLAARDCLEGVVESDPDYVDGRAWLGYLYADQFHHRWNERPDSYDSLERALEIAEEAVRLDPTNHVAHAGLALTCFLRGETERAKIEVQRAIGLNPNNALWLALLGNYLVLSGDFDRGLPMARKAARLNPYPPGWLGMAFFVDHYRHERYQEALSTAVGTIEMEGDFREPLFLAATLGQLDRPDEAKDHLERMRRLWGRPVAELRRELIERHALQPGLVNQLMDGLEKAGLEGLGE